MYKHARNSSGDLSRPLLNITTLSRPRRSPRQIVGQIRQRKRAIREMDEEEPGAERVDHVMQAVGVCDAVDGGVEGKGEPEDVGYVSDAGCIVSMLAFN